MHAAILLLALDQQAGLHDILGVTGEKKMNPPGEWNHTKIVAKGTKFEHWLNGTKVLEYELSSPELLAADERAMDFGGEIIPAAIANYNVQAHSFDDYWEDIGTIRAFYETNLMLTEPNPPFSIDHADAPIYEMLEQEA